MYLQIPNPTLPGRDIAKCGGLGLHLAGMDARTGRGEASSGLRSTGPPRRPSAAIAVSSEWFPASYPLGLRHDRSTHDTDGDYQA